MGVLHVSSYSTVSDGDSEESLPLDESTRTDEDHNVFVNRRGLNFFPPVRPTCTCVDCRKEQNRIKKNKIRNCCLCCSKLNRPCLLIGLILSIMGLTLSFYFIESLTVTLVEYQLIIKEGSKRFISWQRGDPPVLYSIRIFNITNGEAFMRGARPFVREVGPYVYEVKEAKEQTYFGEEDSLTYYPRPVYHFKPHLSGGSEDDIVVTLNVPLINAGVQVDGNIVLENVLKIASRIHNFPSLRHLRVGELFWGHRSSVLDWARQLKEVPYPFKHFGLMAGQNDTIQPPYTINTGASDIFNMHSVIKYNGKTSLGVWRSETCDRIHGTVVSGFHPRILRSETLNIFNGQMCRSIPLVFQKNLTHSGLNVYRFIPPANTFVYGSSNPSNDCFCLGGKCPPQGVIDVRACYWGAAIAFSFPHFYQGDPTLRHIVRGLRPDAELHGTQFDIYPKLGVPLRVKLRMQMNVVIDSNQALQRDRHFDVVFPVFWFEAGIDSLPVEMVGMLKMAQDLPSVVKTTSVTVCTALSVIFLFLLLASTFAGWCGITPKSSRAPSPEHLPETAWAANHAHRTHAFLDASGYRAGSMTSLAPGDSCGTVLPPYRKSFCPHDETDNFANNTFDIPPSEDQPPAYTSANETKASSPSLVSVQIHNSASIHSLNAPPTPSEILEDEFYIKRSSPDSDNGCFEGKVNPHTVIPTTPPPPIGTPIIAPLAKIENTNVEDPPIEEPLATSSPHESPNTTTTMNSDFPQMNSDEPIMSPSLANRRPTYQNSPKPPPLESDL